MAAEDLADLVAVAQVLRDLVAGGAELLGLVAGAAELLDLSDSPAQVFFFTPTYLKLGRITSIALVTDFSDR